MFNKVILEEIFVKSWKYGNDLFFRLECYQDPDLPQKHPTRPRTQRTMSPFGCSRGSVGALVVVKKGVQIRVHGFLQIRDYKGSLADFLKDARGAEMAIPENLAPNNLRSSRGATEVIACRILSQCNGVKW